jgi:UDP:flavonoid glycosyltransferase YjiC (YdhE family)
MSIKIKKSRPSVLAVDLGTYCDNRLAEIALSAVVKKYHVVYVTDNKHRLDSKLYTKLGFDTPEFFINDPHEAADTKVNFAAWILQHPTHAIQAGLWVKSMRDIIDRAISAHNPVCLLVMNPALPVVWMLDKDFKLPVHVLYVAPAMVSYSLPWLFDSDVKDTNIPLYIRSNANRDSGLAYLDRISKVMLFARKKPFQVYKKIHHVLCYDDVAVPPLKLYRPSSIKVTVVGGLLPKEVVRTPRLEEGSRVSLFLEGCRRDKRVFIFMSFGSYGCTEEFREPLAKLLSVLVEYCATNDTRILFHNGGCVKQYLDKSVVRSKMVNIIDGFVPYESVIPRCKLVIFTGSVCLQNICLYNAKPMLFCPLLNEQYFWARNYAHHTGIPYIDYRSWDILKDTNAFIILLHEAMRVNAYLERVKANMHKIGQRTPPQRILALVDDCAR